MILARLLTNLVVFLCTYFVHSTIVLAPVRWLVAKRRWPANPGLRSQLVKLSIAAPLTRTLTMTALEGPH